MNIDNLYAELVKDNRLDKNSLDRKLNVIKRSHDQSSDFLSEMICAKHLLKLEQIEKVIFQESPDIKVELMKNDIMGVEVKRFREKAEDIRDRKNASKAEGVVCVGYRDGKVNWIKTVSDEICKKSSKMNNNSYNIKNILLFLKSDSDFQIEWGEIENGIVDAHNSLNNGIPFNAIFYETYWENDPRIPVIFIKYNSFEKKLCEYLKMNNYFHLKLLCSDGKIEDL